MSNSLPQRDHVCANCKKEVGKDCSRKRRVVEGYCMDWEPKTSLGAK